ncbi:MAG: serine protease [Mycolicibacterium cosmeticum]|nr:serine protease [Mycolicibacterium cosmeticum]
MGTFHSRRWLTALIAVLVAVLPAAPAAAAPEDLSGAIAAVEPSVVRIDTTNDYQHVMGTGTGIVLDANGQVMTNYHVIQGADTINTSVNGRPFAADIVGFDRRRDIAVIQLRGAGGLPATPLGDSAQLAIGDPVVALGNARGSGSPLTRETGTISAFGRTISAEDELTGSANQMTGLFEIAAPVRAGDSGGPVVNGAGQVVGITTAASVNFRMGPGGEGFAIPINDALAIANQIRAAAPSDTVHIGPPTLLGVGVSTAEQHEAFPGVLVHEVLRGGPAERAGLANGDVLLTLDGIQLDSATTLTSVLDRHYPGDVIGLTWIDRAGQQQVGKATLTAGD